MQNAVFQSRMNLLALVAMLLLALLPTLGRLVQAGAGDVGTALVQMCTTGGLKSVKSPFPAGQPDAPSPMPGAGPDCAYCPLLGTLAVVAVALVLALLVFAPVALPVRRDAPSRLRQHPSGLGSRGPPVSFVIAS